MDESLFKKRTAKNCSTCIKHACCIATQTLAYILECMGREYSKWQHYTENFIDNTILTGESSPELVILPDMGIENRSIIIEMED